MAKQLECDCGEVVEADDAEHLVEAAQAHAREAHGLELPGELILLASAPTHEREATA